MVTNANELDQNLGSIGQSRLAAAGAIDEIDRGLGIGVVEIGVEEEIGPGTGIATTAETGTLPVGEVAANRICPGHRSPKRPMLARVSLINSSRTEPGTVNTIITCSTKGWPTIINRQG